MHQALFNLLKDYRSPQMLYAIISLNEFYDKYGKEKFVKEYERIRKKESNQILRQDKEKKIEAMQTTLHYQRRLVSHFYNMLATFYINGVLPKDIVYANWTEADLRIIPEILVPIENKLRAVIFDPPLEPLDMNCSLLVLYNNSIKYGGEKCLH